ncbi:MAG: c-type cytochrome [Gammaproteobacteria bacterium]|nr:c-type cytochrome [Gammaproteobacteria bacterium]
MKLPLFNKLILLVMAGIFKSSMVYADFSKSFDGHTVFNTYCFICHGTEGKGDGPLAGKLQTKPADLTNNRRLSRRTDKELAHIIEGIIPHGQIGDEMPRWGLAIPKPKIESLVAYIRYLHQGAHALPGKPEQGKVIYDSYCKQCHAADGEGNGILTKVFDIKPANHTDAEIMDKISNKQLHAIIANGGAGASLMPGWKAILTDDDIDDVISYIRLLAAH